MTGESIVPLPQLIARQTWNYFFSAFTEGWRGGGEGGNAYSWGLQGRVRVRKFQRMRDIIFILHSI
jgi:hypothetical protein